MYRLNFATAVALVGTLLFTPFAAGAQDGNVANGQKFGSWSVSCQAVAVNKTNCALSQQLLRDTDRTFMAQMVALWSGGGDQQFLAARVPLGTYLAAGIALRNVESEEVHELVWQSCGQNFCEALMELTPDLIDELAGGESNVVVSYRPRINAEQRVFSFSTEGLAEGLAALKPTP